MKMTKIKFIKMHGLGNDYIYVDADTYVIDNPAEFSIQWSPRHTGIGADGLVLYGKDRSGYYRMRIFNADGSEALMCGNAIRCVGKILYERGYISSDTIDILTNSGIKHLKLTVRDHKVTDATVDMNPPTVMENLERVELDEVTLSGIGVGIGNPHWITFLEGGATVEEYPLERIGPKVEHHPLFEDRTNFEIVEVVSEHHIRMRVWERGSGITMACGTGACASGVAAIHTGRAKSPVTVSMPGGDLVIEWDGSLSSPVYMTGGATYVFDGELFSPHVTIK